MPDIMLILSCLSQSVDKTSLGRLGCVVEGLLAMTGRVTMRGLSRWTERGGSYRTLRRCSGCSTPRSVGAKCIGW
jgi:putative transposase